MIEIRKTDKGHAVTIEVEGFPESVKGDRVLRKALSIGHDALRKQHKTNDARLDEMIARLQRRKEVAIDLTVK